MAQYTTGTVSVTNGSATVTGSGTLWSANVVVGAWITITSSGLSYQVQTVDSNTQITLTSNYNGVTASGQTYVIFQDFTSNYSLPLIYPNDLQTAAMFTRAMQIIDTTMSLASDSSVTTLAGCTDTIISTPTDGQFLMYDGVGAKWINASFSGALAVSDLSDVTLAGPTTGDLLSFTGSIWEDKSYAELYISRYNTAETRTADINMSDNIVQRPKIQDYSITHTTPSSSSGAITFDHSTGQSFKVSLSENITSITLSNPPASGSYGEIRIRFVQGASAYTVSGWPASVKWASGVPYTASTTNGDIDVVVLTTDDGGTVWLANFSKGYA